MKQIVRFLILLRFSLATLVSPNTCPCDVPLSSVCVPDKVNVRIPCPNVTGEMTLKLFKDQDLISKVQCSEKNCTLNWTEEKTRGGVEVYRDKPGRSVDFKLVRVTESSQGMYWCEGEKHFPPPSVPVPCSVRVQLVIQGHICRCNQTSHTQYNNQSNQAGLNWIWILMVAFLGVYGLAVTVLLIVVWVRMKNADSQNDYINTKPRAPRDARGKRQLQKPVPRHF